MKLLDPDEPQFVSESAIAQVCLCHHIRRAARSVTRAFDLALRDVGLNYSQFNMLVVIATLEPASGSDVARELAMDRTTMSRNIMPLKRRGFIDVNAGRGRRAAILRLSPAGQMVLKNGSALWRNAQREVSSKLGPSKTAQLLEILADAHSHLY